MPSVPPIFPVSRASAYPGGQREHERDRDHGDADDRGVREPAGIVRVEEVLDVGPGRAGVEPERQVLHVEQIAQRLQRRHQHPVEREREHDRERRDDDVRRDFLAQAERHHATSARLAKMSIVIATTASTGRRKSETAAPSPSEPPWMPVWNAHVVITCVELNGPPFVRM